MRMMMMNIMYLERISILKGDVQYPVAKLKGE